MAETENELCIDDTDLITSFSNPNYTPSSSVLHNNNGYHSKTSGHCHNNRNFLPPSDSYDELGNVLMTSVSNGDTEMSSICFFRKEDSASSTDSAISSPSSDSALASPCIVISDEQVKANESEDGAPSTETNGLVKEDDLEKSNGKVSTTDSTQSVDDKQSEDSGTDETALPPGWQKCEDNDGPYYWHIKSGTIQRDPPKICSDQQQAGSLSTSLSAVDVSASSPDVVLTGKPPHTESDGPEGSLEREAAVTVEQQYPIRFAVRSLGWVSIAEEELSQERSSRAVNKCIVDLSSGKKDINDVVGRWGDGKYLFMDLDQENLSLIDPHDLTVLNVQPIKAIRVWGVGRDNGRDFAYVARDRNTRRFMCHVFRCELPARHIASTLCDICKKVIAKRSAIKALGNDASGHVGRPTDLPSRERSASNQPPNTDDILKNSSFPTPMDEPKKVMTCHYLGTTQVPMATGVEILNGAIELLNARIPADKWTYVNVTVAPSTITITEHEAPNNIVAECRVRFLSFLGISVKNIKMCSFIMHTAQDHFVAHVFHCEPSAGALCKIIEAACKLRYQKCLDRTLSSSSSMSPLDQRQDAMEASSPGPKSLLRVEPSNQDSALSLAQSLLARGRAGLSSSAAVLTSATASMKTGLTENASIVRARVSTASVAVVDGLSTAKEGLVSTIDSLRRKAGRYLTDEQQD